MHAQRHAASSVCVSDFLEVGGCKLRSHHIKRAPLSPQSHFCVPPTECFDSLARIGQKHSAIFRIPENRIPFVFVFVFVFAFVLLPLPIFWLSLLAKQNKTTRKKETNYSQPKGTKPKHKKKKKKKLRVCGGGRQQIRL